MENAGEMQDKHIYSSMKENFAETRKEFGDPKLRIGFINGSHGSSDILESRLGVKDNREQFRGTEWGDVGRVRYSTPMHSDEGASSYVVAKNRSDLDKLKDVEYLAQNRAEILRELDELKDRLIRQSRKLKEQVPMDRRVVHEDPYGGSENWFPDKHVAGPSYISRYTKPPPFTNTRDMSMHTPNQIKGFEDPLRSRMLVRPSSGVPHPLQQEYPHPYYSAPYINNGMANFDILKAYSNRIDMHPLSCSCSHCHNKHSQVLPPARSPAYRDKRLLGDPNILMPYNGYPRGLALQDYDPRNYHYSQWPNDLNLEAAVLNRQHHPKAVLSSGGRRCYPIAGGAPFFTCYSCFELLELPKKVLHTGRSRMKMRCAACSRLILLAVSDKKLLLSNYEEAKEIPAEIDSSSNMATKNSSNLDETSGSMDSSSDYYNNSGCDFQSADKELVSASPGQGLSSNQSAEISSIHFSSVRTSENENSTDVLISTNKESNSFELPREATPPRPPPGSPLQDHIDYSIKFGVMNRSEKERHNDQSEEEMGILMKVISRQHYAQDAAVSIELDISSNEYFNTGTSIDSGDISRENDKLRAKKGSPSFYGGIIRKSFEDQSRSGDIAVEERATVTVNGHPIPDALVSKAEKLAGVIQPGEYWYDSRAGFWGFIGGPCLGIIPPSIEEFDYPMLESCSGGETGVFVNGRELHHKDLKLLGKRGLPTETNRSYIIEISGRVLDEDSGEELDSLGKLAPTVEKTKHGFGMRAPRAAR